MTHDRLIAAALTLALLAPLGLRADDMDIPLAVTTLASPSQRTTPTTAEQGLSDKYLHAGLDFLQKNAPQRAVQELLDSVRLAPGADNYKALGTAYYQAGNVPKAVWAYRESLKLRPDAKVLALADQLQGVHSDSQVMASANKMAEAKQRLDAGRRDSALNSYLEAWSENRSAEAAGPALRLAASLAEEDLRSKALARAIETLSKVEPLKATPDLSPADKAAIGRLVQVEDQTTAMTGQKLREHQAAMLSDREAWERRMTEIVNKKVEKVDIHNQGAGN